MEAAAAAADEEVGGSGGGEIGAISLSIGLFEFDGLNEYVKMLVGLAC